jgi:hypothetical protein
MRNKSKRINKRRLTNKKQRKYKKSSQKGGASKKLSNIIRDVFLQPSIKYLPSTNIFMSNLENKYVNMIDLIELRNIIDSNKYLKSSNVILNIYKNKNIMNVSDIRRNIDLSIVNSSLQENIRLLFQHIIDYNIHNNDLFDQGFVKKDVDIYSVITCSDRYDKEFELEVESVLMNKLFDIRDLDGILKEASLKLSSDKTFKDVVASKLKECSKNPTSLFDFFTGNISFSSNKKCEAPPDTLVKFNKQNLMFLVDDILDIPRKDKIKLLIYFEHRLTLLSRYFSLEILRQKNTRKSDVKKILNKIHNLDINENKRKQYGGAPDPDELLVDVNGNPVSSDGTYTPTTSSSSVSLNTGESISSNNAQPTSNPISSFFSPTAPTEPTAPTAPTPPTEPTAPAVPSAEPSSESDSDKSKKSSDDTPFWAKLVGGPTLPSKTESDDPTVKTKYLTSVSSTSSGKLGDTSEDRKNSTININLNNNKDNDSSTFGLKDANRNLMLQNEQQNLMNQQPSPEEPKETPPQGPAINIDNKDRKDKKDTPLPVAAPQEGEPSPSPFNLGQDKNKDKDKDKDKDKGEQVDEFGKPKTPKTPKTPMDPEEEKKFVDDEDEEEVVDEQEEVVEDKEEVVEDKEEIEEELIQETKYSKEQMDRIIDDIDISKVLKEAEMEYYREMPHQFKKYNDKKENNLTFSEQLSLRDRCENFKNEISKTNEIKVKPDSIQLLNKCPDEIYEEIIRRGISQLDY